MYVYSEFISKIRTHCESVINKLSKSMSSDMTPEHDTHIIMLWNLTENSAFFHNSTYYSHEFVRFISIFMVITPV